ncbi:MAG: hypothetical protein AB7F36_10460 [Reyranellaceae bacterium]
MKMKIIVAALAIGMAAPVLGAGTAYAGCTHGERIDGSTAADAQRKIQAAGYTNVTGLTKGCDNFWHGMATQNGQRLGVVLSPSGQVMVESGNEGAAPSRSIAAEPEYPVRQRVYPQQ